MIEKHPQFVHRAGQSMKKTAERVRHRLAYKMVVETGQVMPAGITPPLDQACSEHHPECEPAEKPDHDPLRLHIGRPQKDCQETALQKQRFPSEGVESLADIGEGEVEQPEQKPDQH